MKVIRRRDLNDTDFYTRLLPLLETEGACVEGLDYVRFGQANGYSLRDLATRARDYSADGGSWVLWVMDHIYDNAEAEVATELLMAGIGDDPRLAASYFLKFTKLTKEGEDFLKSKFLSTHRPDGKKVLPEIEDRLATKKLSHVARK